MSEKVLIDKCLLTFIENMTSANRQEVLGNIYYLSEEQVGKIRADKKGNDQNTACSRRKIRYPGTDIDLCFKTKKRFGSIETEVYIWKARLLEFTRQDIEDSVIEGILLGGNND
jgi:hypothetical protein